MPASPRETPLQWLHRLRHPAQPVDREDLGVLRQTAFHLWLVNVAFGMVVLGTQLQFVPEDHSVKLWVYALLALTSTIAFLSVVPGVFCLLIIKPLVKFRVLRLGHAMIWTSFLILLFVDKSIYNLFRYHFSSQVWDLFVTRGSEDAIHLGWQVWTAILTGLVFASGVQIWIWDKLLLRSRRDPDTLPHLLARPGMLWCAIIVSSFFLEKMIYIQADIDRDKEVIELAKLFPLYPQLNVGEMAEQFFDVQVTERAERLTFDGLRLDYPAAMPKMDPDAPKPNILIIAIDCWRADMLNESNAPRLNEYANGGRRFTDHISTGNATRFGVFGMLYGLYGPYWFPVLNEQRSPVLVDTLLEAGYDFEIYSSASANYPQLRSTAWSALPGKVHDKHDSEFPWRRDELAAEMCVDWWKERIEQGDDSPFFSFILLDSPHQKYSHPAETATFQPEVPSLNYLDMTISGQVPELSEQIMIKNRYQNAVLHADKVAADLLASLEELGLAEDTVVVVTGDHGEEFWETGLFGHTSSFSPPQVRVPMILKGPGVEPGTESTPTSHLDLPATLLELAGADPTQRGNWTLGDTLLKTHSVNRQRVVSGWDKLALWTRAGILEVPLEGGLTSFDIQLYSYDWQHILDDEDVIGRHKDALERLAEGCNRFRK
jgi:membrane-anchored protein YejM (alkaline phosphatase superfamily)